MIPIYYTFCPNKATRTDNLEARIKGLSKFTKKSQVVDYFFNFSNPWGTSSAHEKKSDLVAKIRKKYK